MVSRPIVLLLAVLAVPAQAQVASKPAPPATAAPAPARPAAAASGLEGSWAFRVDGTTIFRYDLAKAADGSWTGTWARPGTLASDGNTFSNLAGPPRVARASAGKAIGEWAELSFPDNRPGAVPDVFRFRLIGEDRAEMVYADTGLAPYILVRVPAGAPIGPWEAGHVYRRRSVELMGLPPDPAGVEALAPAAPPPAPAASPPRPQGQPGASGWSLPPSPAPPDRTSQDVKGR